VPDDVIARVESAPDQAAASFDLACELAEHAMSVPGVSGLHLISFAGGERIGELCRRIGIKPTAEREADAHSPSVAV
jgi:methylenetetrahydrofolate reductase (NADPH)